MNKTIEAFLRGYIFFKVNDKVFFRYNSALAEIKSIDGNVNFIGFNILYLLLLHPWRCFFLRVGTRPTKCSRRVNAALKKEFMKCEDCQNESVARRIRCCYCGALLCARCWVSNKHFTNHHIPGRKTCLYWFIGSPSSPWCQ